MNDLTPEVNPLTSAVRRWADECKDSGNSRISHALPVQLADLMDNIHKIVKDMPKGTYDFTNDSGGKELGLKNLWHALAYYLGRHQGSNVVESLEFAKERNNSLRSASYNMKAAMMNRDPRTPIFIVAHKTTNRDMEVLTFDGDYMLNSGKTVSSIADDKDRKDWKAKTLRMLARRGVSDTKAKRIADRIDNNIDVIVDDYQQEKLESFI